MNIKKDLFLNFAPHLPHICFAEADAAEAPVAGDAAAGDAEPEIELEDEDAPTAEELAELEIGSDRIKVDKRVKDAWDGLQTASQKKSETVNEQLKAIAVDREQINERARVFEAVQKQVIEIANIDQQIAPYEKLTHQDWIAWGQQDAAAANNALTQVNALRLRRQQLAGVAEATVKEAQAKESLHASTRAADSERAIAAAFKDWSPAKRESLVKTATEYGFQPNELTEAFRDPRALSIVQDAMKYRAALAKASAKPRAAAAASDDGDAPAAARPTPAARIRGNAGSKANDLSDKVSTNDWVRNFNKLRKGSK